MHHIKRTIFLPILIVAAIIIASVAFFLISPAKASHRVPPPSNLRTNGKASSGSLELITPNGGENWEAGQTHTIKWKQATQKTVDSVSIHYIKHNQQEELITLRYFFNPLVLEESFNWKISAVLGDEYESFKIKIRGFRNDVEVAEDISEGYFTIVPGGQSAPKTLSIQLKKDSLQLAVTAPNGGEVFKQGKTISIKWIEMYLNFIDIGFISTNAPLKDISEADVDWLVKDLKIHPNNTEGIYSFQIAEDRDFRDVYYKIYIVGERSNVSTVADISDDFFTITRDGSATVGASQLQYPKTANHGDTIAFSWKQENIDLVRLFYTPKPFTLDSTFNLIVDDYPVVGAEGTYQWRVPGKDVLPKGYYATKVEGYIKNNKVSEEVGTKYIWIGDVSDKDYKGEESLIDPRILDIETSVEQISSSSVQIRWEDKNAELSLGTAAVEYGLTRKYGNSKLFTVDSTQRGTVSLTNLIPGDVYHYRISQAQKTTQDFTFGFPGAIKRVAYTVLNQTPKDMSVRLQFETESSGPFGIYFCKDVCGEKWERFVKVGESLDTTFLATNDLLAGQSGTYIVVKETPGALQYNLGARIDVINTPQAPRDIPPPSVPESVIIKNTALFNRIKGRIILKVESAGEAYYVNPVTQTAYYLGRPELAFNILRTQGIGITNADLDKIPVGFGMLTGNDTDDDRLSDDMEEALGTDPQNPDTDGDGFTDWLELTINTSPYKDKGTLPIDMDFTKTQLGKIFLQVENRGQAWYINPIDGKRYFLGRPTDAWNIMRSLGVGISNNDFERL